MSKNSEQQQMDPLADPIVDTITNEPATDETGFITTPFLGMEFQSMSTMGSLQDKSKKGINIHVESVEDAISEVNSFELDFLVMDISIHKQTFQQQKKTSTASQPSLLDLRQICHKHTISSKRYLFRTTDWSHCMVGKVDESAFQAAFGIYNNNNKKLLSSEKPYEVPAIDEYLCGQPSPVKKTKQNNSHAIPSTAGTLSQVHLQAQAAKLIIHQEIQWASHLCLPAVLFPEPQGKEMTIALAQFINKILPSMGSTAVWVRFSVQNYHLWNLMRTMCQSNNLLVPVLDIKNRDIEELAQSCKPAQDGDKKKKKTPNTPETAQHYPQEVFWNPFEKQTFGCENPLVTALSVWIAENVRTIILNLDNFAAPQNNVSHFLNEGLEQFIRKSFKYDIQFIFNTGADSSPNMKIYKRAIMSLFENCPVLSKVEAFSKSFRDFLQRPLQPLIDNLESQTYEVFERDPIKYLLYEQAAEKALVDLYEAKKSKLANDPEALKNMRVITMVLGAGRGPIVKAVLRAARTVNVPVLVYAVEKNPNALSHLLYYRKTIWSTFTQANGHDNLDVPIVEVIQKDMRVWNPPEKADLLVSELLGSFGDNELSPECLDGAQRLLKDNGEGISIPAKYTSYASPLCSYKVWTEVKNLVKSTAFEHSAFETGYVCLVHRGVPLDKPQRCFTFVHPNPQVTEDLKEKEILRDHEDDSSTLHVPLVNNDRYVSLKFKSQQNAVVHGLIGYFDCQLYKDVWMSILPDTFSTGMFSWFPIFFPIENPVIVKKGEDIGVQIWRNCDMDIGRKVWYEWCVTTNGTCSKIHNSQGKHYYISL